MVEDRVLNPGDMPDGYVWLTPLDPDSVGIGGLCDGPGELEFPGAEDAEHEFVSYTNPAAGQQINEAVFEYGDGAITEAVLDGTLEAARCGTWTSDDGDVNTVEVEDVDPPEGIERAALFLVTIDHGGGQVLHVAQLFGVRHTSLVALTVLSTDPDQTRAGLDEITPVAMNRALRGDPSLPEAPTLAEWVEFIGPVWTGTRGQLSRIDYGSTLPEYAAGLAQFSVVLGGQIRWLTMYPLPAAQGDDVEELRSLVATQRDLIDQQQAAAAAGDRAGIDALTDDYSANTAARDAAAAALGLPAG